jgi:hypothetical protein
MNGNHKELTDEEREELLRLILMEASGTDANEQLERFPANARSLFRRVVVQAGLVKVKELSQHGMENRFVEPKLSEKGLLRLNELNGRFGGIV